MSISAASDSGSFAPLAAPDSIGSIDLGAVQSVTYSLSEGSAYKISVQAYNDFDLGPYSNVEEFNLGDQ